MTKFKLNPKIAAQLMSLELSAEEGFVLSRVDGNTDVRELHHLTGMGESRLHEIIEKLERYGVIETIQTSAPATSTPPTIAQQRRTGPPQNRDMDDTVENQAPIEDRVDDVETAFEDDTDWQGLLSDGDLDEHEEAQEDALEATLTAPAPQLAGDEAAVAADGGLVSTTAGSSVHLTATSENVEPGDEEDAVAEEEARVATYRQLYEQELRPAPRDERVRGAQCASDVHLCAYCFDPDPAVIRSLLDNPQFGLLHARLVAAHHPNPVGLDALGRIASFVRDGQVQRLLYRNAQSSEVLVRRLLQGKPLKTLFALTRSREMTERTKRTVRQTFRRAFQHADAEQRVTLLFSSEGRCLATLLGLSLEGKTVALLCGRTYHSPLLIQNLARWPATPPVLIAHLFKQSVVRRSPQLRQALLQHPNCPSQVKRQTR